MTPEEYAALPSIVDQFPSDHPESCACHGDGIVCEDHPDCAWPDHDCGGAGMPCQKAQV